MLKYDRKILEYKKNFRKIYEKEISPIIKKSESERKKSLIKLFIIEFILAVTAFFIYFYFVEHESIDPGYKYFACMMLFGLADIVLIVILPFLFNGEFALKMKECCMARLLSSFEHIKWYNNKDIISDNELERSRLFASFNTRISDDAFEGSYKDIDFKITETRLLMKESSGSKYRKEVNIFKGIIVSFNINKKVNNLTLLTSKYDTKIANRYVSGGAVILSAALLLGVILNNGQIRYEYEIPAFLAGVTIIWLIEKMTGAYISRNYEKLNEVILEDIEFHKKYRVYSSDQTEARYLITPSFMERFKGIQTAFGTENVKCSFYDGNKLMFAVSTNKNAFEIGDLFHGMNKYDRMRTFFDEIASIYALIDYFKLDEKTRL